MVEGIKQIGSELRVEAVLGTEVIILREGQIKVGNTGCADVWNRSRGITDRELGQGRKDGRIEPLGVSGTAELGVLAVP